MISYFLVNPVSLPICIQKYQFWQQFDLLGPMLTPDVNILVRLPLGTKFQFSRFNGLAYEKIYSKKVTVFIRLDISENQFTKKINLLISWKQLQYTDRLHIGYCLFYPPYVNLISLKYTITLVCRCTGNAVSRNHPFCSLSWPKPTLFVCSLFFFSRSLACISCAVKKCDTPVRTTRWITGQDRIVSKKLISTGGPRGYSHTVRLIPTFFNKLKWNKHVNFNINLSVLLLQTSCWLKNLVVAVHMLTHEYFFPLHSDTHTHIFCKHKIGQFRLKPIKTATFHDWILTFSLKNIYARTNWCNWGPRGGNGTIIWF